MTRDVGQQVNALDKDHIGSFIPSNVTVWRFEQIPKELSSIDSTDERITGVPKT